MLVFSVVILRPEKKFHLLECCGGQFSHMPHTLSSGLPRLLRWLRTLTDHPVKQLYLFADQSIHICLKICMSTAAKQIDVLAKISKSTEVCGTQFLILPVSKNVQWGSNWDCMEANRQDWPQLLLRVPERVCTFGTWHCQGTDRWGAQHTGEQVCRAVQQASRRSDVGIVCYGCHFLGHKIERTKNIIPHPTSECWQKTAGSAPDVSEVRVPHDKMSCVTVAHDNFTLFSAFHERFFGLFIESTLCVWICFGRQRAAF